MGQHGLVYLMVIIEWAKGQLAVKKVDKRLGRRTKVEKQDPSMSRIPAT